MLFFFPGGNRETGLAQLATAARTGFYTGPEARFFQMRILASARKNRPAQALESARALCAEYPDNPCFARSFATSCFAEGRFADCERASRDILTKVSRGLPGYDGASGRVAAYYLGYLRQTLYRDPVQAADYYRRSVVFSETLQLTTGYYLFAHGALARLAAQQNDVAAACRYYAVVVTKFSKREAAHQEALSYLRRYDSSKSWR